MALLQRRTTSGNRARVLAAYGAVTVVAVPVGTILGGPLVAGFGARGALLCCALGIAGFGLVAAVIRGAAQVLRSGRSRPMVRPITDGEPDI
jgi:DHA3 family macrolide efflux protein-like MFS transporter